MRKNVITSKQCLYNLANLLSCVYLFIAYFFLRELGLMLSFHNNIREEVCNDLYAEDCILFLEWLPFKSEWSRTTKQLGAR